MTDYLQKTRDRLKKLRTLTEAPHGVDYDRVRSYFSGVPTIKPSDTAYKIRHEVHSSNRHNLVEELALTSQFLAAVRGVLEPWEADLVEKYPKASEDEVIAYIDKQYGWKWSKESLRNRVLKIKKKLGAINEVVLPTEDLNAPVFDKPVLAKAVDDILEQSFETAKKRATCRGMGSDYTKKKIGKVFKTKIQKI